jgi:hypothetical protein
VEGGDTTLGGGGTLPGAARGVGDFKSRAQYEHRVLRSHVQGGESVMEGGGGGTPRAGGGTLLGAARGVQGVQGQSTS